MPARDVHGFDSFAALQLADHNAGQLGLASPFAFAGHDEIQVELADQRHAVGAGGVVDAGEDLVEQDQARRMKITAAGVETGDGGEQRHGQAERALAARGRAGKLAPLAVLPALDAEVVPTAVVERAGELFKQAAAVHLGASSAVRSATSCL